MDVIKIVAEVLIYLSLLHSLSILLETVNIWRDK